MESSDSQEHVSVSSPSKRPRPRLEGQEAENLVITHEPEGEVLFHIRSIQASAFRHLFDILGNFLVDTNMVLNSDGIEIRTMDSAMVAMVHVNIMGSSLEHFIVKKPTVVGVNLAQLNCMFRSITNKDHISMYILEDHPEVLHVCVENTTKVLHYKYTLLDIEEEVVSLPNMLYDFKIQISSNELHRHLRDVGAIGDEVTVTVAKEHGPNIRMETKGDFASVSLVLNHIQDRSTDDFSTFGTDPSAINELEDGKCICVTYPLKYLTTFSRACILGGSAIVLVKRDFPIILQYQFCDMGRLTFIVSPKIIDE